MPKLESQLMVSPSFLIPCPSVHNIISSQREEDNEVGEENY